MRPSNYARLILGQCGFGERTTLTTTKRAALRCKTKSRNNKIPLLFFDLVRAVQS